MTDSIAIVGGGAGGIFAALAARKASTETGHPIDVHLFERNPRLGIKILISGGGKCNITHAGPVSDLLREGFPNVGEQRFLRHAFYRYTNEDVIQLLARHGVPVHARENGRIFPDSGRAGDVLRAFEQKLQERGVQLHLGTRVEGIEYDNRWHIRVGGESFEARAIVLATGGTSYSKTGTTGDGIRYASMLGHTIVPIRAALAPLYLEQPPPMDTIGIAFRNATISIVRNETVLTTREGDILLTHRGLSGPAVLGISNRAAIEMEKGPVSVEINLLNETEEGLRERLLQEQQLRPQQQVSTWLETVLPNRFVDFVLSQAAIDSNRRWNALTREERSRLVQALHRYSFGRISEVPLERGEVTSGGVELSEVNSKTMMSRLRPGLFFAGEMLDIAGEIGGYNLQAAYSTGWIAGEEAVKFVLPAATVFS